MGKHSLKNIVIAFAIVTVAILPLLTLWGNVQINDMPTFIEDTRKKANISSLSVVIVEPDKVSYFSDDKTALYQIGSMTKAYTALGIQLLIDQEKLSLNNTVSQCIDGFTALYEGESAQITVEQLLAQTSGYTNAESIYPSATAGMSLSDWCESISGRELASKPGEVYTYSNVNYNLLGLIIEKVSGMSYSDYMTENVFEPLGLFNTYCGTPRARSKIVEGTRQGFLLTFPYEKTVSEGSVPAGYIYSNAVDMGRWLEIQMGLCDIPESISAALSKIHATATEQYYGGWEITDFGALGHSGGTPNYSSRIVFDETRQIGVCVLANLNSAGTVDTLCNSLFKMSAGIGEGAYTADIWRIMDSIFTSVTLACIIIILLLAMSKNMRKSTAVTTATVIVSITAAVLIVFPLIFMADWPIIFTIWAPFSMLSGVVLLCLCSIVAILKILSVYRAKKQNNE